MLVLWPKLTWCLSVRCEHAPDRAARHPHRHVQKGDDTMLAQQVRPLDAIRHADILEGDRRANPEGAAGRRRRAGRERSMAHHTQLPADASPDEQVVRLGPVLHDLGSLNAETCRSMRCGLCEQGVEVEVLLERTDTERGDESLMPGRAALHRRVSAMVFHRKPPGRRTRSVYSGPTHSRMRFSPRSPCRPMRAVTVLRSGWSGLTETRLVHRPPCTRPAGSTRPEARLFHVRASGAARPAGLPAHSANRANTSASSAWRCTPVFSKTRCKCNRVVPEVI